LNDFMSQALEYGVILRNEIPEEFPQIRADLGKVTRVLTNLIDNALKFTPAGGQIILSAARHGSHLIAVQVNDTGPGVPEEFREKIFERFSQVPGLVGRRRGSGLGLTFCRLALEAQGGRIWVEPRPGGGSSFVFTLPAAR
jgi:signal transduction histidine kinase